MLSPGDRAEHCAIVSRLCSLSLRSRELGSLGCTGPSDAWAQAQPTGVHLQPIAQSAQLVLHVHRHPRQPGLQGVMLLPQ